MVLGGLLSISFLQLPIIRKSMRMQTEQEIYSRIMEEELNSKVLMAKKAQYLQRDFAFSQYFLNGEHYTLRH